MVMRRSGEARRERREKFCLFVFAYLLKKSVRLWSCVPLQDSLSVRSYYRLLRGLGSQYHYRLYPVSLDHPLAHPFGLELCPAVGLPPSRIPLSSFFVVSATYTTTIVFPLVSGLSVKNPFVCGAFHWFVDFYPATEHRHNMADPGPFLQRFWSSSKMRPSETIVPPSRLSQ
jgi:hypothetical protein